MTDLAILWLRVLFVALLYLFVAIALFLLWRDLRRRAGQATPEANPSGVSLRVLDPARSGVVKGARFTVNDRASIGRLSENTVSLPDDSVSGRHASLVREEGRWWVEDHGSTNGTLVNGRAVTSKVVVVPGDEISVGLVRLRFERE